MAKYRKPKVQPVGLDANVVWAAACAAHRINNGYNKEAVVSLKEGDTVETAKANKILMRSIISEPAQITPEDRAQAEVVRTYWRNKLMEVLAGTATDFASKAVAVAGKEEILSNDYMSLGTIAFLPEGYVRGLKRDAERKKKDDAIAVSSHFGNIGEKVSGSATVIESRYSENWGTYYITAQFGTNVILFAYRKNLEGGLTINLNGTVKAHRENDVTQLNRVRIEG